MSEPGSGPAVDDAALNAILASAIAPYRAPFEAALDALAARWSGPAPLPEAMRYAALGAGKRLRPALVLAATRAAGGRMDAAMAPAIALELVHAYSLVHDDLPPMDNDVERRGRPTVHVAYGEANAILVGDALLTEAFAVIADADLLASEQKVRCISALATAAGARGMVGGQVLDISGAASTPEALMTMHAAKTGALFVAACRMGSACAAAPDEAEAALVAYAEALGVAFQIGDDLIDLADIEGVPDAHEALVNLAARFGPSQANDRVVAAVALALDALAALPGDAESLRRLAEWTRARAARALRLAGRE